MNIVKAIASRKRVLFDMTLNIMAASLPVAALQLIIYPQVAKDVGGDEYGLMLTLYSIWIMISNSLGNVLNNIKLLRYSEYEELKDEGDIALLLRRWIAGSSFIIFVVFWAYCGEFSPVHIIVGTVISVTILLKAYLEVEFRIKLNYIAILISNGLLSLGYLIGFALFWLTGVWEFIFLFGFGLASLYCIMKTDLLKEKPRKTSIYVSVRKDSYSLVISAIISNLINYADKLVLYPLMGGTAVSIYYTATIMGKITGMLTGPINSVVLSYITRWDKRRANVFTKILIIGVITVALGYVFTLIIARPVIGRLFPQWVDSVMEIIPLTTVTIMLTILTSFLQPFVMRYCKLQWQIGINGIGSATYFTCALLLWRIWGLKGFCVGTIVGIVVKLMIMIIVYYKTIATNSQE